LALERADEVDGLAARMPDEALRKAAQQEGGLAGLGVDAHHGVSVS